MQENFLIPMICIKPPLVAYLERNGFFNFDKMVLSYVKTVIDSPALSVSFQINPRELRNFYRFRNYAKRKLLAQVRHNRGFIARQVIEQKIIQKGHSVNRQ